MDKSKALKHALLTVLPPTLILWGATGYYIGGEDGAIAFLIFASITLVLVVPIAYWHYRKGHPIQRERRYHVRAAILYGVLALAWTLLTIFTSRDPWGIPLKAAYAIVWLGMAIDQTHRAKKARAAVADSPTIV